jgi:general stress protein 26
MRTDELLLIARETIDKVPFCFAITVADQHVPNARVVLPGKLGDDWQVRFLTHRRCRKVKEMERSGRLTLAYQYDPERAYVILLGRPRLLDDVEVKRTLWQEDSHKWFPGGPEDPNVVVVELITERIELRNSDRGVLPEPVGLSAAFLEREGAGWRYGST